MPLRNPFSLACFEKIDIKKPTTLNGHIFKIKPTAPLPATRGTQRVKL